MTTIPATIADTQQPGFFILSQSGERPERYVESFRFDAMPSSPRKHSGIRSRHLVLDVLVEPDAGADFDQDRGERGLVDLEAARGAAGQQPPLPVPAGSPPVRFPGFEGYRRLMGPRGEAAN